MNKNFAVIYIAGIWGMIAVVKRQIMTLKDLPVGKSGLVVAIGGEKMLRRRLLEMGITPHTTITVKKTAPMGDPIELLLRGYVLSLRLADAEKITIEEVA